MPSILDYLNTISDARYGRDVRQAIVDAISACYQDGKAGVSDLEARRLIESAIGVNESQQADIDTLYAQIADIQGGGDSSQESTTITLDTVIYDGGFVDSVTVNNNATKTYDVTFTQTFTEVPEVFACVAVQNSAAASYSKVTVGIVKAQTTKTGFRFFIANTSGATRSTTVVWAAFQPTTKEIDLDITIPSGDGMSEADVRAITNPIQTSLDGIKTGYDGTVYSTPGEAVRTQINDLHVLIGDEPGTAISGSSVDYDGTDSGLSATNMQSAVDEVADALSSTNERLDEYEDIFTGDVGESVENWLDEHPEATTTVQDESLTYKKLVPGTLGFKTPEMFGAVGNGDSDNATDDTTALQSAISGGGVVHLKSGATYLISGTITISAPVIIYGHGATIKQSAVKKNTLYATGVSNITIDGVHIIGHGNDYVGQGGQSGPYGIYITSASDNHVKNIHVRNCIVEFCTWSGISVANADDVFVENNIVKGTGTQDLSHLSNYQFGITLGYGKNIKATGNDVSETAQGFYIGKKVYSIELSGNYIHDIPGQHGVYATAGVDFLFINNVVNDIEIEGIKLQLDDASDENAENVFISGNTFTNIGSFPIHCVNLGYSTNGYVISNISVDNNKIKNSSDGIFTANTNGVSISENIINDSAYGIRFGRATGETSICRNVLTNITNNGIAPYTTGATVKDLFIEDNILSECGQIGSGTVSTAILLLNFNADNIYITGNTVSDVNNLSDYAVDLGGQSTSCVFKHNTIKNSPVRLSAALTEFSDNVCEGALTISSTQYRGSKATIYSGSLAGLPTNTSAYRNGDIYVITDATATGYAFAMMLNKTWVMLGKKDDYVIHPFTITSGLTSRITINSVSVVSEGDTLTVNVNATINERGSEVAIGSFSADSGLLPSAKTSIPAATGLTFTLNQSGYLTMGAGTAGQTYDLTAVFIGGVLQTE